MHWAWLSLISALFLGLYDIFQKHALRGSPVLPVLVVSTGTAASVWTLLLVLQTLWPELCPPLLHVPPLTLVEHAELLLKSLIVASSWLCTYVAVKHLPLSLAAPIRATGPLWTLLAALWLLGEQPSWLQLLGVLTTLSSFFALSLLGRREGVHFHRNRWVAWMILGTLLAAGSALYDKLLLAKLQLAPSSVQAWFSIYLFALFGPLGLGWWWKRRAASEVEPIKFGASMPAIALALLCADFAYFCALRDPDGLVSLVASMRRGATLIAFAAGVLWFKEPNGWQKLGPVLGILTGIALTLLG